MLTCNYTLTQAMNYIMQARPLINPNPGTYEIIYRFSEITSIIRLRTFKKEINNQNN